MLLCTLWETAAGADRHDYKLLQKENKNTQTTIKQLVTLIQNRSYYKKSLSQINEKGFFRLK